MTKYSLYNILGLLHNVGFEIILSVMQSRIFLISLITEETKLDASKGLEFAGKTNILVSLKGT
jgi:hypothetical protein